MLDRLPPAARHLILLCVVSPLVALAGVLIAAVLAASGIGVDWPTALRSGVDAAAVVAASGLGAWIAAWVTPLVGSYGVSSQKPSGQDDGPTFGDELL